MTVGGTGRASRAFDIRGIKAAQAAIFPDGGHRATHDFRHRSRLEKGIVGLRFHRHTLLGALALSLWFAAVVALFVQPGPLRFAPDAVRRMAAEAEAGAGREALRQTYDRLSREDRQRVTAFVNGR